jgi:hypothetical protein
MENSKDKEAVISASSEEPQGTKASEPLDNDSFESALLFEAEAPHTDDKEKESETGKHAYFRHDFNQPIAPDDEVLVCIERPGMGRKQADGLKCWRHDEAGNETAA